MFDFSYDDEANQLEGLRLKLEEIPMYLANEIQVNALKKAAKPMLEAMQLRCPQDFLNEYSGETLLQSLRIAKSRFEQIGEYNVIVGARKKKGGHGFLAHFFEFGTSKMAARPFMRPAEQATATEVERIYYEELQKEFDKRIQE